MSEVIVPPTERTCELCGREDRWDEDVGTWVIDGEEGSATCIHEWDINGDYNPVQEPGNA
ncbi:HEWD family protein [Halosegnis sp.]|uniref:HEWD family protein n=1 Tax=Halosegnis sp. TaxID=2864959 RepID=UPI0035D4D1F1